MDYYLLIATLTLLSQIGVFVILLSSLQLKKIGKFREKGFLMTAGVALHLISIYVIMLPSFLLGLLPKIVEPHVLVNTLLVPIHVGFGIAVSFLALWIIWAWRFRRSLESCAPKKVWMRRTLYIWSVSLISGVVLYLYLFWKRLFG